MTDTGVYGLGDATVNGREMAVVTYLEEHVIPCLIGRDPSNIEDIWQYLYKGVYWRKGPINMAAIAAIDMALWDIKGKVAGLPVYQLLGGKSRKGVTLGHKRICFITQHFDSVKSRNERYQGYLEAHLKHGMSVDNQLIQYWHRETGFEFSPTELLSQLNPPSAFFTQHLAITTALLENLEHGNITIPNDVSVISFDDIPMAKFFKVPITAVSYTHLTLPTIYSV